MAIELRVAGEAASVRLESFRLVIAGYTGRDAEAVEQHIRELAAHGIPRPAEVPAFYELSSELLRVAPTDLDVGETTSGEAEPVLIRDSGGELYLGVGSDHTDRELERRSILESKRSCPKLVGPDVWRFEDAADEWDLLELSSTADGRPYQRGTLSLIRRPEELVSLMPRGVAAATSFVLYLGTLPLLDGSFRFAGEFSASLARPRDDGRLSCSYRY